MPPYVIFQDKTLLEIAQREPGSLDALAAISGVGQSKIDRYGKGVLAVLGSGPDDEGSRPATRIDRARALRSEASLPERLLWAKLSSRQLAGFKFRRQHPVEPYVLDFYCAEVKLAVEIDGETHSDPDRAAQDRRRDEWLLERGIRTLRLEARIVLDDIHAALDHIARVAKAR